MRFDIEKHINKSVERLGGKDYALAKVFQNSAYEWQGDYEGRCLLAFCNLHTLTDGKFDKDEELFKEIPSRLNEHGYFGTLTDSVTEEQRLAGHGWLLRGLVEYAKLHDDDTAIIMAKKIVKSLYFPVIDKLDFYKLGKDTTQGGVSGNNLTEEDGWRYSSDVGCLFISVDGLAEYYIATKDNDALTLINKLIEKYVRIDFVGKKMQTHATLTALRGILRLYDETKNDKYLEIVKNVFETYVKYGMTATYCNFNWFGRENTWTEPCAIVDSMIIAVSLYKITNDASYRTLARRICFNGLTHSHRANGGAGPDSCVTPDSPVLKTEMYEAPFCCTMRYCEGLKYIYDNQEVFADEDAVEKLKDGRTLIGDVLKVKESATGKELLLTDVAFPDNDDTRYLVFEKEDDR